MADVKLETNKLFRTFKTQKEAIDYIWQVKGDNDESLRRVEAVANSGVFTDEEMSWVMLLLIMPKVNEIIKTSDEWKNFKAMKKESVH